MANYDRPRMTFIRANAVKRKMKVPTEDSDVIAGLGDYIVIFRTKNTPCLITTTLPRVDRIKNPLSINSYFRSIYLLRWFIWTIEGYGLMASFRP